MVDEWVSCDQLTVRLVVNSEWMKLYTNGGRIVRSFGCLQIGVFDINRSLNNFNMAKFSKTLLLIASKLGLSDDEKILR